MSLLSDIHNGVHDGELDNILAAVHERKKWRGLAIIYSANVGDAVRISDNVKPKYLAGARGTVISIMRDKIRVDVGYTGGRFSGVITVPPSLIEKA